MIACVDKSLLFVYLNDQVNALYKKYLYHFPVNQLQSNAAKYVYEFWLFATSSG